MGKNCLVEYLTPHCANCPDWADGTDDRGKRKKVQELCLL